MSCPQLRMAIRWLFIILGCLISGSLMQLGLQFRTREVLAFEDQEIERYSKEASFCPSLEENHPGPKRHLKLVLLS